MRRAGAEGVVQKSGAKDESSRSGTLTFNMERTYGLSPSKKGRRYGAEPRFRFVRTGAGAGQATAECCTAGEGQVARYWGGCARAPCTRP